MTWTMTDRGSGSSINSSADIVSGAFTPAANTLLLFIEIHSEDDGSIVGISGHGTWEQIFIGVNKGPQANSEFEVWVVSFLDPLSIIVMCTVSTHFVSTFR